MSDDYERIAQAIEFIRANVRSQPQLEEVAEHTGLSPFHFQRLFRRWAGVTPKRFLEFLTVQSAKQRLREAKSVLDVSFDLGLSSAGRLHDHFVSLEAVTPGEYKQRGEGLYIRYGLHDSPFGPMFVARTDRGVCALAFVPNEAVGEELDVLRKRWPHASVGEDQVDTAELAGRIFHRASDDVEKIHLTVQGTNFQINVWKALLKIPAGQILSYQQVAAHVGKPSAHRAVATAVAANPIGYLIPCHRVLRSSGQIGEYHWGSTRKQAMVAWEAAREGASGEEADESSRRARRSK